MTYVVHFLTALSKVPVLFFLLCISFTSSLEHDSTRNTTPGLQHASGHCFKSLAVLMLQQVIQTKTNKKKNPCTVLFTVLTQLTGLFFDVDLFVLARGCASDGSYRVFTSLRIISSDKRVKCDLFLVPLMF